MENIHENKFTLVDIINDPFGFTYNEINDVIGECNSKALYSLLYRNISRAKTHTIWAKSITKDIDTQKYSKFI